MARIREAVEAIRTRVDLEPRVGIIGDTGLTGLVDEIEIRVALPYQEVSRYPLSTRVTNPRRLVLGRIAGIPAVVMEGRFHGYEGYSLQEESFPVRIMKLLKAGILVTSGVWGSLNPLWRAGELILLDDHINLLGDNPLVGDNLDELGPRFPDMSEPYDRSLRKTAEAAALEAGVRLNRGVFVAFPGPGRETGAEYRMLRQIGADVVGDSTVPEVIVARHMDMRVLGLGLIGHECLSGSPEPTDPARTMEIAMQAKPKLTALIRDVVSQL